MARFGADEFTRLLEFVRATRVDRAQDLAIGKWQNESDARTLVGWIRALDAVESEMAKITGSSQTFGEKEI